MQYQHSFWLHKHSLYNADKHDFFSMNIIWEYLHFVMFAYIFLFFYEEFWRKINKQLAFMHVCGYLSQRVRRIGE